MELILPESYHDEKKGMTDLFNQSLEKVINENQWRDEPYFVTYHDNDDKVKRNVVRAKWATHDEVPTMWRRQICYWVDNKKGFKEWIWTISDEGKPFINTDGIDKAKRNGALRQRK